MLLPTLKRSHRFSPVGKGPCPDLSPETAHTVSFQENKNMKISDLTPEQLVQFSENVATLLGGTALSSIDPAVRTDLLTALGTLPADLAGQDADAFVQSAQAKASYAARNVTLDATALVMRNVRDFLIASNAPKEQFDLCAFDYPFGPRASIVAQIPSDLAVEGFSNHENRGRFQGNNKSGSVSYEVWRREGDEGPWMLRLSTRKQRFTEYGVTPGQYYEYKVRAVAARKVSGFSNKTVVYGL
jgi:hypothetical protein